MLVTAWEFESPLRHHKKINGLEEIFFLLARFSFSAATYLPHFAPTFGKLPKIFCISACQPPRLLRGTRSTLTTLLFVKLLMGILTECLWGAFFFSLHSPSSLSLVSSKKIRPPPAFCTEEGRNAGYPASWVVPTAFFTRPSQPLDQKTSSKGNVLRK